MVADFSDLEREFPDAVRTLRSGPLPNPQSERPSEQLWHSISSAVAQEQSGGLRLVEDFDSPNGIDQARLRPVPSSPPLVDDNQRGAGGRINQDFVHSAADRDSSVVEIAPRRLGRRMAISFASAAAVILVGIPLFLGLRGDNSPGLDGAVELAAIGSSSADGEAALAGRTLSVGIDALESAPESSTYELWLLQVDPEGTPVGIEWIGTVDDAESVDQTFEVPAEIDTGLYTVVDVSIEPDDGDLSHSGNSILRGQLTQS